MNRRFGPLVTLCVADAYGACFEGCDAAVCRERNDLAGYKTNPHFPKSKSDKGRYTDDGQLSLGLAEFMLYAGGTDCKGAGATPAALAWHLVNAYRRDPRSGYMPGFRKVLATSADGADFLKRILPHSTKSGGAMRAGLCGLLPTRQDVVDLAMWQASLTHATMAGMTSAAAAALMSWHCRNGTAVSDIPHDIAETFPFWGFDDPWEDDPEGVPNLGVPVVRAALTALQAGGQAAILKACVDMGGDTDTVAAVAMCAAALHPDVEPDLPDALFSGLETGPFGLEFLDALDRKLFAKFGLPFPGDGTVPETPPAGDGIFDLFG